MTLELAPSARRLALALFAPLAMVGCAVQRPAPGPSPTLTPPLGAAGAPPAATAVAPSPPPPPLLAAPAPPPPAQADWRSVDAAVQAQIDAQAIPGAVVVMGDADTLWLRRAYGDRALIPRREAMTVDTVFDLASLTKVIATTTSILQLAQQGLMRLDAPVAAYWPAFAAAGKDTITVEQLLTHTSGLKAGLAPNERWATPAQGLALVAAQRPVAPPGVRTLYSDLNFVALGEVVRRVAGQPLAAYARRHIFDPLGMKHTLFSPGPWLLPHIAPTEVLSDGIPLRGRVHDPTARRLGSGAGNAGLFGTADDLARYAQSLLQGRGRAPVLLPDTVKAMARPRAPLEALPWRGLGWQLDAPLVPNRDELPPAGLILHTGYTGTGLWIDLVQRRFLIVLSNRVHPFGKGDARPLRRQLIALMSSVAPSRPPGDLAAVAPALASLPHPSPQPDDLPRVKSGIDVLRQSGFAPLQGRRVGLITNLSAVDARGWRTLDRLRLAPGVQLTRLFTPEHGLNRDAEGRIPSGVEPLSGLPTVSLYGAVRQPTPAMLKDLDTLVFDMQDAGARYFTYISTMGLAMEAAAASGVHFVVLDRPNPVGADLVRGPVLDADQRSFTGYAPLPVQHGMTVGELARLFQADIQRRLERHVDLTVIPMQGYQRAMRFDQTGLDWIPPSPNLRTVAAALLYPGTAWVEGSNVSVGRGTADAFTWVGAPWIDGKRLADALQAEALPGLRFSPKELRPPTGPYRTERCQGVRVEITDRTALNAPLLGLTLVHTLARLWPNEFQRDRTAPIIGSRQTMEDLRNGLSPREIAARWEPALDEFRRRRQAYLLY